MGIIFAGLVFENIFDDMSSVRKGLYKQWCKTYLEETVKEWFFGNDYTIGDIIAEKELMEVFISNKFLTYCSDNNLLED